MFKKIITYVGVLAFMLFISGCGEKTLLENRMEKALEKELGGKAEVELGKETVKIETNEGSIQVGGNVVLPKDFPSDVYIIDGQLMTSMKNVVGTGYQVAIKSTASVKDAKELYEKKLKEQGWTSVSSYDMGTAAVISVKKGKRQLTVTLGTEEGKEGLAVILTLSEDQFQEPN